MCRKPAMQIKKVSSVNRLRTPRLLQVQRPPTEAPRPTPPRPAGCTGEHSTCPRSQSLVGIAMRTVVLLHRNRQLQLRLAALQRETSAFVSSVMNNPENRRRYEVHARQFSRFARPASAPTPNTPATAAEETKPSTPTVKLEKDS